jgi:hypothetical protein
MIKQNDQYLYTYGNKNLKRSFPKEIADWPFFRWEGNEFQNYM